MYDKKALLLILSICVLVAAGCGGGGDDSGLPPAPVGGGGPAYDPSTATASVSGSIMFDGTPPEMPLIQMAADPFCQNGFAGATSKEVLVTEDGKARVRDHLRAFGPRRPKLQRSGRSCRNRPDRMQLYTACVHDDVGPDADNSQQRRDASQHPCVGRSQHRVQHRAACPGTWKQCKSSPSLKCRCRCAATCTGGWKLSSAYSTTRSTHPQGKRVISHWTCLREHTKLSPGMSAMASRRPR